MASASYPWPGLVEAIRGFRLAVRMKWSGGDDPPSWEPWIIVSSVSYLETGKVGPVPFKEVDWVEIDPIRRSEGGRLVAVDQSDELTRALKAASVTFEVVDGVFRVAAGAG